MCSPHESTRKRCVEVTLAWVGRVASAALEARRSTLAEKLARKERRRDKRKKKQLANGHASGDADLDGQSYLNPSVFLFVSCQNLFEPVLIN